MFQNYDLIRIISLPTRQDRRKDITHELRNVGVVIDGHRVAFFDAIKPDDPAGFYSAGARGCFLSHLGVLSEAGEQSVLIIEDDCDFVHGILSVRPPICDIFWAGYNGIPREEGWNGSQLIGYSPGIALRVAGYLSDLISVGRCISFDGALVHFEQDNPDMRLVFAPKSLGRQRPSKTDIGESVWKERLPFINLARKLKRRRARLMEKLIAKDC